MNITIRLSDSDTRTMHFEEHVRLYEIASMVQDLYDDDIILAIVNGKLSELSKKQTKDAEISFLTTADRDGKRAYRRSMIMVVAKAVSNLFGQKTQLRVLHSLGEGYYCEIFGIPQNSCPYKTQENQSGMQRLALDVHTLEQLRTHIDVLVEQNRPIHKKNYSTGKVEKMFAQAGYQDKERLFHYRRSSSTNLYELDGYFDYFYGYMAPSTGMLRYYDLELYENGFLLRLPGSDSRKADKGDISGKLFHTLMESRQWSRQLHIGTIGALNDAIAQGKGQDIILLQEALMETKIGELAATLSEHREKKFIMVAGPSSSGKTTFANRLSIQLRAKGLIPHPVSLDDYYVNRVDTPKHPDGSYDFECLEAIDIELFNRNMQDLLAGKTVSMPTYNFRTGLREFRGNTLTLGPDDVLVIEGIHGLNDRLSYSLSAECKFKIYISALTQLNIDEHNPLSTTDGRMLRRMVRDNRTRNLSAKDTIRMWPSVRNGEERNIFPFQESADAMFNSALVYELAVLKIYAEPLLFQIGPGEEEYFEAQRLLKFLDYLLPLPTDGISYNSLLREFVGGGIVS